MRPFNGSFVDQRESCRPDDNSTSRSDNGTFFFLSGWLADGRHDGPSTIADPSIRLVFFFFFFFFISQKQKKFIPDIWSACLPSFAISLSPRLWAGHGYTTGMDRILSPSVDITHFIYIKGKYKEVYLK